MPDAGRYRIDRHLGQGGMGEVMEAYVRGEGGFERRVAIKRLLADCGSDEMFLRSFADEARIVSQLHHANIVGVFDFGLMDGNPFLVFEFIDGLDIAALEERCTGLGRRIPPEIALHITTEIAHALDYAHGARDREGRRMGIVHRDVSPENILISWAGDVKLADFGIAFALRRLEATEAGVRKGKRTYMAPEQRRGDEVDARDDLFSLGCVLHRLLVGRSPLERKEGGQYRPTEKCELEPSLDPDIREILVRATQAHREQRFSAASEMAAACGSALLRRLSRDPRGMLREWMERLRPVEGALHDRPGFGADLLDLDLVLEPSSGPVPRFGSRVRSRETEVGSRPRDTQILGGDKTMPEYHAPTTILAGPRAGPRPAKRVRVAVPISLGLILVAALGIFAALIRARGEGGGPVPRFGPQQTLAGPKVPIAVQLEPAAGDPQDGTSAAGEHGRAERDEGTGGTAPDGRAEEDHGTAVTGAQGGDGQAVGGGLAGERAGAVAVRPRTEIAKAPPPPSPAAALHRPARAAPRERHTLAEMRAELTAALDRRGLELGDLGSDPPARLIVERWRRAERREDRVAGEAALRELLDVAASFPIHETLLQEKLTKISSLLATHAASLPKQDLDALELRYVDARAALSPGLSSQQLEALARKIRALAIDVDRLR